MPTYDYRCSACEHEFELVQSMNAPVKRKCPECGRLRLERLIGVGGGFIIKGGAASVKAQAAEKAEDEKSRKAAARASDKAEESTKPSKTKAADSKPAVKDTPEKKPESTRKADPEKKLSGSTSTPTHKAREGRGVGNLVDAARRRSRESADRAGSRKKNPAPKPRKGISD